MCGIVGLWRFAGANEELLKQAARRMNDTLAHRGPDDSGIWADGEGGIVLGQRRLSIVDLSPAGHQPMQSACGRYVITYNGEIYNSPELRRELAHRNIAWRGHSDTETMVEAIAAWGLQAAVEKFIGMFAFALWDRKTRSLSLVRDRFGIKPIYWTCVSGKLLFGSELKSIVAHPDFVARIDRGALASYMRFAYVPAPASIYAGVSKLPPGHILVARSADDIVQSQFWNLREIAARGLTKAQEDLADAEATDALDGLLRDAVRRRMVADVPLGAFLSGGIDSSTVVALMQAQSTRPVQTFTISFGERGYDESGYAREVARHLGTDHTEMRVSPNEARDVIPKLPDMYDEPFADSSQIPTYLVSRLARQKVIVALSGDGGDELFAGYERYRWASAIAHKMRFWPAPICRWTQAMLTGFSGGRWDRLLRLLPLGAYTGNKARSVCDMLALCDPGQLVRHAMTTWGDPGQIVPRAEELRTLLWDRSVETTFPSLTERMQILDALTYLPDDILTKVDRASMAVGLEARVPLIDHRVAEFAFSLPARMRVRGDESKWLLRQVLYQYVPRHMIDRPKMGFGVPVGNWLRGPLRGWAEDLLSEKSLARDGMLSSGPIRVVWAQHLAGSHDWTSRLWTVLMFQSWRRRWAAA